MHHGFSAEVRLRRLARKRKSRKGVLTDSNSSDDADCQFEVREITTTPSTPSSQRHQDREEVTRVQPSNKRNHNEMTPQHPSPASSGNSTTSPRDNPVQVQCQLPTTSAASEHDQMASTSSALFEDQPPATPPGGWELNTNEYFRKVAHMVKYSMYMELNKGQVHSFQEKLRKAQLRRTPAEKHFWEVADPHIDAFMMMLGRKRDVFSINAFAKHHPETTVDLLKLRQKANVG